MSFTTPDFQAIRDSYLRDIGNQLPGANVASDGDYYIRGNAIGGAVEGLYQHQQWILRQIFADTADSDYLEKHASRKSLYRKAATLATGTITFSGQVGSPVPIGTEAKTVSGMAYMTTAADVIGANGTVAAYFAGFKPGDTAYANKIRSLISDTAGVVDFTMTAPAANVVATVDANNTQMAVLGTVTWS